jgi:homoserine O-acetyltransferase
MFRRMVSLIVCGYAAVVTAHAQQAAVPPADVPIPESCTVLPANAPPRNYPAPVEGDWKAHDFQFTSGERLPEVRIHYCTIGQPQRDGAGVVRNAVLLLHGTGGSGRQFLQPRFANVLFGPGQLLDATKYFIVLVDNVGHGKSSKPSDGLRTRFPHYDYDDMVRLQHDLLTEGLHVNHLRLILGTSMGCMHSWVWGERYRDFMDALMPLACLPTEIAGRNRMWREMAMNAIRNDPAWQNGNYQQQPQQGLREAADLLIIAGSAPLLTQKQAPTRDAADKLLGEREKAATEHTDANDLLYQIDSSRNYNPRPDLESVRVPVMAVNSADDFINPPELGIMEREIKRVAKGQYVLIPISDQTRGHGTHTSAAVWKDRLEDLLRDSGGMAPGTSAGTGNPVPGVYQAGGNVTAPKPIYTPEPEFPDEARRRKLQGGVTVAIIVGPDGLVHQAAVTKTSDSVFNKNAIAAVKNWRFQPGMKDGQPVAVSLHVEITFNLQQVSPNHP